jgi:hypothetical protein
MDNKMKRGFKWRGMTTFLLILALLVDTVSGVVLYITPPGRFANWTNWTLWGVTKQQWGAIHTIFSYLLLIIVAFHLYYNWRVVVHFAWSKIRKAINLRRELAVATVIALLVFIGTLWNVQPFSAVMDFGDRMKHSWERGQISARGAGYGRKDLANSRENDHLTLERPKVTSQRVSHSEPDFPSGRGGGFGRKTLEVVFSENGLTVKEGLSRLENNGIKASPMDRLREIANRSGRTPNEIIQLIMKG